LKTQSPVCLWTEKVQIARQRLSRPSIGRINAPFSLFQKIKNEIHGTVPRPGSAGFGLISAGTLNMIYFYRRIRLNFSHQACRQLAAYFKVLMMGSGTSESFMQHHALTAVGRRRKFVNP
jgi:hypothetical protein